MAGPESGFVLVLTVLSLVLAARVRIQKNPDRCLPLSKANSMSKSERAATARKKETTRRKQKRQFVSNTAAGRVTNS